MPKSSFINGYFKMGLVATSSSLALPGFVPYLATMRVTRVRQISHLLSLLSILESMHLCVSLSGRCISFEVEDREEPIDVAPSTLLQALVLELE